MKFFTILMTLSMAASCAAQPVGWKVSHNSNAVLTATKEDSEKNTVTVSRSDLQEKGALVVVYKDKHAEAGWKREIILVDQDENEIARGGNKLTTENTVLYNHLSKGAKSFHVYTWTLPTDPEKAALIRIRRVHLCTIIVK